MVAQDMCLGDQLQCIDIYLNIFIISCLQVLYTAEQEAASAANLYFQDEDCSVLNNVKYMY